MRSVDTPTPGPTAGDFAIAPPGPRSRRFPWLRRALLVVLAALAAVPLAAQNAPVAVPDVVPVTLTPGKILLDVLANDSHPRGEAITVTWVSEVPAPALGQVVIHDDGTLTLDLQSTGGLTQITLSYTVTDSSGSPASSTLIVGGGGGGGPLAVDDEYPAVGEGETEILEVLVNDVGDDLEIVAVAPPGAAAIGTGGQYLVFTAAEAGTYQFDYTIRSGGSGPTSTATVTVHVIGDPNPGPGTVTPLGEVGEIPNLTHQPQWVQLAQSYHRPVAIVQPPTLAGGDASAVRVLAVEDDRFQVRLQEAAPGDGFHCPGGTDPCIGESVSYLVVEAGRWELGSGLVLEADTLVTDWTQNAPVGPAPVVSFSETMPAVPAVLSQVQSAADPAWVVTREGAVGTESFVVGLQEEPPFTDGHGAETIGWVAVTPGVAFPGDLRFAAATRSCAPSAAGTCLLTYGTTFDGVVRLLASVSSFADDDTVELRRQELLADAARVVLEEPLGPSGQPGGGNGMPHPAEDVSLLAVGGDGVLTAIGTNRPPRVFDAALTVGPAGLQYQPEVLDPDSDDDFWVAELAWVPGQELPGNPSVDSDGRTILYQPPSQGFTGTGAFTVRVRDRAQGGFLSEPAVITLSWDPGFVIDARDDHYSAHPEELVLTVGGATVFDDDVLLANDLPSQGLFVPHVADIPGVTRGHVRIAGNAPGGTSILYEAPLDPSEAGEDVFEYTASEGTGTATDTATVSVLVLPGNRPPVAEDDVVPVAAGVPQVTISDATLLANDDDPDGDVLAVTGWEDLTTLGALTRQSDSFRYEPGSLFQYLGSDRFRYTASDPDGESDEALVTLQSDPPGPMVFEDFFDDGTLDAWTTTFVPAGGSVTVTPAAAISGSHGLAVTATESSTFVFAVTRAPTAEPHVELFFQVDPHGLAMATGADHVVAAGISGGGTSFDLRLGRTATGYQVRAVAFRDDGSAAATSWIDLGDEPAAMRAEWWAATEPGTGDGGLRLVIDEQAAAEVTGLDNDERVVETLRLGIAGGLDPGTVGTLRLDTVRLWRGWRARPVLLADPFEDGDLALWGSTYVPSGGSLEVTASAAIEGNGGLAVGLVPGSTYAYAQRSSLGGGSGLVGGNVSVFFRLDPAALTLAAGTDHVVFSAAPATSGVTADVRLGWTGAAHRLRAFAFTDGGTPQGTPWLEVPPGPVTVRLEVVTASWREPDGWLRLWVNGQPAGFLIGLNNRSKRIDRLRLGAVGGVDGSTSGTYHVDDFRAWGNP